MKLENLKLNLVRLLNKNEIDQEFLLSGLAVISSGTVLGHQVGSYVGRPFEGAAVGAVVSTVAVAAVTLKHLPVAPVVLKVLKK